MHWLGVALVCLVIASFSLLGFALARRRFAVDPAPDPAVVALRDEVMGQISRREPVELEPHSSDSFHVKSDRGATLASVSRLYFAIADAPDLRERLVGEYVEGLILRVRRPA